MEWKLELIAVPVSDIDRAKDFYVSIGFNADHDHTVDED
ncbi:MAG TPA: glyoxalase, partial [Rhodoglobus sp.]|nr:glyoxalase [Rhodoglobus sp.]